VTPLEGVDPRALPREELPALLGRLCELEAVVRLRLAEGPTAAPAEPDRVLTIAEGAVIAGASPRWVRAATAGLACRCDLSRKQPRLRERPFRAWLAGRRKR
jgi:hypothetical protein